jgi:hypothetical protein
MNPLLVIAVPLVLIILGMILNSLNVTFDQPPSSAEQEPVKRLTAERESYRQIFYNQRERAVKRQKRVGQYAWLLMIATIGSFVWLYVDTVKKTTLENRIAALQTLGTDEGKQTVLSVTLLDGDNAKYIIKPDKTVDTAKAETAQKEKVSSWELSDLGTALSRGDTSLPLGISLKIANKD